MKLLRLCKVDMFLVINDGGSGSGGGGGDGEFRKCYWRKIELSEIENF